MKSQNLLKQNPISSDSVLLVDELYFQTLVQSHRGNFPGQKEGVVFMKGLLLL